LITPIRTAIYSNKLHGYISCESSNSHAMTMYVVVKPANCIAPVFYDKKKNDQLYVL